MCLLSVLFPCGCICMRPSVCFSNYKITNYESAFSNLISKLTVYQVSSTEINSNIRCVATNVMGNGEAAPVIEGMFLSFD